MRRATQITWVRLSLVPFRPLCSFETGISGKQGIHTTSRAILLALSVMEQTPALSMSPSTGSPLPDVPSTASPRLAEAFTPIPSPSPDNLAQERPSSPTETIRLSIETTPDSLIPRTTAERAFQHGLEPGNLQQEVGEVMGVFNSWWGGLKKQVSIFGPYTLPSRLIERHDCSLFLPSLASKRTWIRP